MRLLVRTADRVNQGYLDLTPEAIAGATVGDLLDAGRDNFRIPSDAEYSLRSERMGKQLDRSQTLTAAGIQDGDVLELVPILRAGS